MNHRDARELLDEFLDGALGAEARWRVTEHLAECPDCRTQVAARARLRGVVRERLTAVEPAPGLSMRLTSALAAESITPPPATQKMRSPLPVRWVVFVAPVLAALWLLVAVGMPAARSDEDLTRELVATHTLFAHDESMLDVAGDDRVVAAWFRDAAGLQVSARPLDGYTLVGGRLIAFEGRPVAQLVYEGSPEGVYVSLLEFQHDNRNPVQRALGALGDQGRVAFVQQGAMSLATWISGDEHVALVGMVPSEELRRLVNDLSAPADGIPAPGA
jgi:anti-sigma factor RsiW